MTTESQGPMPSPTLRLSPSLSRSPHPTDEGSKTYHSSRMGASDHLHQVSKITCKYHIRPRGWGAGSSISFVPSSPPCSLLHFARHGGSCHQLLDGREGCFGHHLFCFLNRSWGGRGECGICSLIYPPIQESLALSSGVHRD